MLGIIRKQAAVHIDLYIFVGCKTAAEHLYTLLGGEAAIRLMIIYHNDDYYPVKQLRSPANDVNVAAGDRVEAAGAKRCSHLIIPSGKS